ncbi:MAG: hypothetical protein ACLSUW_06825 [Akkermansia sp.]
MPRIRFITAYDGRPYLGWQSQPGGRTVQDKLERAFSTLFGEAVRIHGSGRTTPAFMLWARFSCRRSGYPPHSCGQMACRAQHAPAPNHPDYPCGIRSARFPCPVQCHGKTTVTAFHALPSSTLLTPGWPGTARWHGAWIFWNRLYTCSGDA